MRPFESQGLWYLPETPKDLVAGTLTFSVDRGLILQLTGTLKESADFVAPARYAVIHGFIRDSPYGRLVTLADCFQRRRTFSVPGFASEEIRANRAYVGGHHLATEAEAVFQSLRARYTALGEWSRLSGLHTLVQKRSESRAISIDYREPEPLQFNAYGHALRIGASVRFFHGGREFSIKEQPYVTVENLRTPPRDVLRTFVHPLQDFLSFASDRPIALEEIAFFAAAKTTPEPVYLLFQPIYRQDPDVSDLSSTDMLFTWPDIAGSHSDIIETWLRFRGEFGSACDVFFGLQYAPPAYAEMRFLLSTIALGLIRSKHSDRSAMYRALEALRESLTSERDRRWLDILPTEPELSLPWTAFALATEYKDLLRPVVGDDIEAFITHVVETKRQLFREGGHQTGPERGFQLRQLTEKVALLVKVAILSALGFSRDEITRLVSRSHRYLSLQS